jgi:hypothetical protein
VDEFAKATARRARWVKKEGYYQAWSTGETLAVALVLCDGPILKDMDYTPQEAARRVYGGMGDPPRDFNAWLKSVREYL